MVGVQGDVPRAGLEAREDRGDQVRRAGQGQGDEAFGGGAVGEEEAGDAVGAGVQLGVGEGGSGGYDGYGVRGAGGLAFEEGGQVGGSRSRSFRRRRASLQARPQALPQERHPPEELPPVRLRQAPQQPRQRPRLGGVFRLLPPARAGLQRDLRSPPVLPVHRPHREVRRPALGEVADGRRVPGKVQHPGEGAVVDHHRPRRARRSGQAEVAVDVLAPVALVPQRRPHLTVHVVEECLPGHAGVDREAQGDDVGDEAREGGEDTVRTGPAGDGEADQEVTGAGEAVHLEGRGRDQRAGGAGTGTLCNRLQRVSVQGERDDAGADRGVGRRAAEVRRVGEAGEVVGPVRAVRCEAGGGAVLGVRVDGLAQGRERRRVDRIAAGQGRVDGGCALGHEDEADAVGDQVVVGVVPEPVVVGEADQGVRVEGVAGRVEGAQPVRVHPPHSVLKGVEVETGKVRVLGLPEGLAGPFGTVAEHGAQAVVLGHGLPQRRREQVRVDGAVDLQVFADAVHREYAGRALFGEPDLALGRGRGKSGAVAGRHGSTSGVVREKGGLGGEIREGYAGRNVGETGCSGLLPEPGTGTDRKQGRTRQGETRGGTGRDRRRDRKGPEAGRDWRRGGPRAKPEQDRRGVEAWKTDRGRGQVRNHSRAGNPRSEGRWSGGQKARGRRPGKPEPESRLSRPHPTPPGSLSPVTPAEPPKPPPTTPRASSGVHRHSQRSV
ncbi:hypothetical protein Saa2_08529 [Streptomyces acidiscabies]|nr:hypothetical protein Saa2_08529 [Streptomyces acidiscabies]